MTEPIVDSAMSLEEAIAGTTCPDEVRKDLVLIDVLCHSFDSLTHQGQLVVHRELADEVKEIFAELYEQRFPIKQIVPIVVFDWDDNASMAANNTSAFNYRVIESTDTLSNHSYGRAIDINPFLNPYHARSGSILPPGAVRDISKPGTFLEGSDIVRSFTSRGWTWEGLRERPDWHHFQKLT